MRSARVGSGTGSPASAPAGAGGSPRNRPPGLGQSADGATAARFARMRRMRPPSIHGFTLVELIVALALAALLAATGVHGLGAWLTEQQLRDRADALLHALRLARSEAIKRGARVDVCPAAGACAGGPLPWEDGWIVVADAARETQPPILRERRAADGITIRGNRP